MAASTTSISVHNPKNCLIISSSRSSVCSKHSSVTTTLRLPESRNRQELSLSLTKTAAVTAGTVVSILTSSPLAMAAKQIAESPQQDNRGLALLLPVIPAVGWVLYNILGPALNQLNRMRNEKGIILGLGLGGLAASSALYVPSASAASEVVEAESAASGSNSGLLALVVAAAVALEVILLNSMASKSEEKSVSE